MPPAFRLSAYVLAIVIGLAPALVGCGRSTALQDTTAKAVVTNTATAATTEEKVPPANLALSSPAPLSPIPSRFTCDGADISLPFRWGAIPSGTAELALFVVGLQPVHEKLLTSWAVAGLEPSLRSLPVGRAPASAVFGRNSFGRRGYSVCPPRGAKESYVVRLFALPRKLDPPEGFDSEVVFKKMLNYASSSALLTFSYGRHS